VSFGLFSDLDDPRALTGLQEELASDAALAPLAGVLRGVVGEAEDDASTASVGPVQRAVIAAVRGCLAEFRGLVGKPPGVQQLMTTIIGFLIDEPKSSRISDRSSGVNLSVLTSEPSVVFTRSLMQRAVMMHCLTGCARFG